MKTKEKTKVSPIKQRFFKKSEKKRWFAVPQMLLLLCLLPLRLGFASDTPDWEVSTFFGTVNSTTPFEAYVELVLLTIYSLIGAVTVLRIVMGGYRYTTAAGNPQAVKDARSTIQHALIGLVLVLSAFLITDLFLGESGIITQSSGETI